MSNYSKTTDFEAKDSLPTGDSGKIIRGSEFETEFDAISTAIATKADTAGPTFTGTLTFETISDGTINVTAFVDEDNMASNSATLVPTQQSVKAYVDSQLTAQDLDFQADSGGALSIDLDSETMTFTGGTGIDTSGSGNAVTFAIDSTVATLTGTQTLTNKTLTSPDVNTPDIDGGTIDNTVIGGSTAAAGSFTTVSATGNITVGGTVDGRDVATDGSKLDGIEASATADQTASEIRTLVESASDSNVFTDADHSKLDGIEASADVTDATNVTAAGALMDSELTSIASVKALNQGVATSDSPTFAAVTVNGNVEFDGLSGTGSVTVTDILDQDDMSGNSATALATQQSIKAYVDSQVATADTLSEVLTNGNTTGGTNIVFGDSSGASDDRLVFGAGSDLQLYHDGSNSYVKDSGTGDLMLQGVNVRIQGATTGNNMFVGVDNGASTLYHQNNAKLATTSTGIDVTGAITSSGNLTVNGADVTITANIIHSGDTNTFFGFPSDDTFRVVTANTEALRVDSSQNVGIGTSSPATTLTVEGSSANGIELNRNGVDATSSARLFFDSSTNCSSIFNSGGNLLFATGATPGSASGTERVRIDASGNVGINQSSPTRKLHVTSSGSGVVATFGDSEANNTLEVTRTTSNASYSALLATSAVGGFVAGPTMAFSTSNSGGGSITERGRFTSNGHFVIGKSAANNTAAGVTIYGGSTTALGAVSIVRDQDSPLIVNRLTDTGDIAQFRKDGTTIGIIGCDSNSNFLLGQGDTGLSFQPSSDRIIPRNTDGSSRDAAIDLGGSGNRFKDLFMSGAVKGGNGSASAPTFSFGNTTTMGMYRGAANQLAFSTDSTERLRINASGNVGIGTSSPDNLLHVYKGASGHSWSFDGGDAFIVESNDSVSLNLATPASNSANILFSDANARGQGRIIYDHGSDYMGFHTAGISNERMRIDSSGNFMVGTTNTTPGAGNTTAGISLFNDGRIFASKSANTTMSLSRNTSDGNILEFRRDGTSVGSVSVSSSATTYNTSSDQRLKDNIVDAPSASDDIDAIQVRSFDWKADGSHQKYGMVAQELESVAPDAVTGDADSDEMMGVDYSKLVPMMMKEIQSLRARVAQLEGVN